MDCQEIRNEKEDRTAERAIKRALNILEARLQRSCTPLTSPQAVRDYLKLKLALEEREVFFAIWLDAQHRALGDHVPVVEPLEPQTREHQVRCRRPDVDADTDEHDLVLELQAAAQVAEEHATADGRGGSGLACSGSSGPLHQPAAR